jgi:uncharacterized protein
MRPGRGWLWGALAVAAGVAVVAGAVRVLGSGATAGSTVAATASGGLPVVSYRLEGMHGTVQVRVEVAADAESRERGLMGRGRVGPGEGMVFLFPGETRAAFWMRDTRVPLAIAFIRTDGRVVGVAEMAPCPAAPCRLYGSPAPYRAAMELGAGGFRAAGVGVGDRVVPVDPAALPKAE